MFNLDGKVAVIIGGTGGLGEACARALALQGASIVVASRNYEQLQSIAADINQKTGMNAIAMQVDVTNETSVIELYNQTIQRFGTVDILVNAQGINLKQPSTEINFKDWDLMFAVNVKGVMIPCKIFGKLFVEKKQGKIINLSSVRGIRGTKVGNAMYGATKGAVDMITKMLAVEWAIHHVNVNAIGPSTVVTPMTVKAIGLQRLAELRENTLMKKQCTPEDVASACVYLASSEADYVTGQIFYVDGGLTAFG